MAHTPVLSQQRSDTDPQQNLDCLWHFFDRQYGLFPFKGIEWSALYQVYRPQAAGCRSEDQLFALCASLLGHLGDKHVFLDSSSTIYNCRLGKPCSFLEADRIFESMRSTFSTALVCGSYLAYVTAQAAISHMVWGTVGGSIGYVHLGALGGEIADRVSDFDRTLQQLSKTRGLILDVRNNIGGMDRVAKLVADRFADRRRLFMSTQRRSGSAYDAYTAPERWFVEPVPERYSKPVVVLTNSNTISAGETLVMAMRTIPGVTVVGDRTAGALSDAEDGRLPIGWHFTYSVGVWRDYTGRCWEGIGIPPDIQIRNEAQDIKQGTDRALEVAIDVLRAR